MPEIKDKPSRKNFEKIYAVHTACFHPGSPDFLSFEGFEGFCRRESSRLLFITGPDQTPTGYILFRIIGEEAELLSIAVDKTQRNKGLGRKLVGKMIKSLENEGCWSVFLEVSEKNTAAIALYQGFGAIQVGTRKAYYTSPDGSKENALVKKIPLR